MTGSFKISDLLPARGAPSTAAKTSDGGELPTAAVSFAQIEDLFQLLDDHDSSKNKGDAEESEKKLLDSIVSLIQGIEGGKISNKTMASLKGYVAQYSKGDPSALPKLLSVISPAVIQYSLQHPDDFMSVLLALAPLMSQTGENVISHVKQASHAFEQFEAEYAKSTDPNKEIKLAEVLSQISDSDALQGINDATEVFTPQFEKLYALNPAKTTQIMKGMFQVLYTLGRAGSEGLKEFAEIFVKSGALTNLANQSPEKIEDALKQLLIISQNVQVGATDPNSAAQQMIIVIPSDPDYPFISIADPMHKMKKGDPSLKEILAQAMESLQNLESEITKNQSILSQFTMQINEAKIQASQKVTAENLQKIQKEHAEIAKASKTHWWDWLIKAILAIVTVIVSAVTAGVGAAIAAALIGVFMSTPLMTMTVKAIANKISGDLYKTYYDKYVKEGKSSDEAQQLAKQKADAVGNLIAQIVVIIAVCVVSFGVGGIEAAGEDAANAGLKAGENALTKIGEDLEENAAGEVEEGSKFQWRGKLAGKVAAFQGLSAVGTTNVWMSAMQTDPEWCKKHGKLMLALDVVAELVTMIASMAAGGAAMSEAGSASVLPEQLASMMARNARYILAFDTLIQAGSSAYSGASSAQNAKYLHDSADLAKEIGVLEAQLTLINGQISQLQGVEKSSSKITGGMIQGDNQIVTALDQGAGTDADAVNRAMLGN